MNSNDRIMQNGDIVRNYPKILFVLRNAWANSISLGNTLSNIFSNWGGEVATIYCRNEKVDNTICKINYRITERDLISNLLHKENIGILEGEESENKQYDDIVNKDYQLYEKAKKYRFHVLLWGREMLWRTDLWKNARLDTFLDYFKPDIVFLPLYDSFYTYRIADYVIKRTGSKLITYIGDDMYGFGKGHLSPLYYIDMLIRRRYIRKSVTRAYLRLCLTREQRDAYESIFGVNFTLMRKCVDCSILPSHQEHKQPLEIVFTGNINLGREETIILLANALDDINQCQVKATINVYTANSVSDKAREYAMTSKSIIFNSSVSPDEVKRIQMYADIVLHVESFVEKYKERVKYSLSTKIVDYLSLGKCILAIGPAGISSIEYLRTNDAAIIIDDIHQLKRGIAKLLNNISMIEEYEDKSWGLANKEHDINSVQKKLYSAICGE